MQALKDLWRRNPSAVVAGAVAILVAFRLIIVIATPLQLGPDEAQYWRWSRTLDFGYYSKPPLIAWVIAASTAVFGDAEWAVRFFSPILHGVAAWFLYLLGKAAYDARIGAWSAAIYLLMPGVWLSSTIMSTDALVLPTWCVALYFLWRMRDAPTMANAALAGAALGLAMLAKYAALYLYLGAALAAIFDKATRKALLSRAGIVMLVASVLVLSPNLIWNALNKFATVSHTADNADLGEAGFNPMHLVSFVGDQMAVFGPLTLIALAIGGAVVLGRKDKWTAERELWLLSFLLPPLVVILGQELISRAHANWAATAYPAAAVLLASWIDRAMGRETSRIKMGPWIKAGVAINALVGAMFAIAWVAPSLGDAVGATNAYKRVRGWDQTAQELNAMAVKTNASVVMFDEREVWHGVDYYGRNIRTLPPIRAWQRGATPRSHAEEAGKMRPGEDQRVLVASYVPEFRPQIRDDFASIEPIGTLTIPLGPIKTRVLKLYLASGYHPQPRTPEYEKKYSETPPEE
ncbi:MAG TPA: glycosyltransferase family 39 protein [Hyphomonadaceae bacterium]|nr:glycosyltransferase family 39 protein [Hyphomonadaceae bacterium]